MKIKKITLPIYFGKLVIIQTNKFQKVNSKYNINFSKKDNKLYDAVVFQDKSNYIVVFHNKFSYSVVAHEVVHLVNLIFKDHNITLDLDNDEPQAYLTGYIFKQCEKFLNKK